MLREKSCGAILFRKENSQLKYLILYKPPSGSFRAAWDFPRGLVEKGETEQQVVKRELEEETGIKEISFIPNFKESVSFFYTKAGQLVRKQVVFLLAQTKQKEVKLSYEHQDFKWASFDEALQLLTHKSSKEILTKAHRFLQTIAFGENSKENK